MKTSRLPFHATLTVPRRSISTDRNVYGRIHACQLADNTDNRHNGGLTCCSTNPGKHSTSPASGMRNEGGYWYEKRKQRDLQGRDQWIAIEFRHRSWYAKEIYSLLDNYHAGIVLHNMPSSGTDLLNEAARFVYLRYHGPLGDYKGGYSDDFLKGVEANYISYERFF